MNDEKKAERPEGERMEKSFRPGSGERVTGTYHPQGTGSRPPVAPAPTSGRFKPDSPPPSEPSSKGDAPAK